MSKRVMLDNRDGIPLYLEGVSDDEYRLIVPKEYDWIVVNASIVPDTDNKEYNYYDPTGGPFLAVGGSIDIENKHRTIVRIARMPDNVVHIFLK